MGIIRLVALGFSIKKKTLRVSRETLYDLREHKLELMCNKMLRG